MVVAPLVPAACACGVRHAGLVLSSLLPQACLSQGLTAALPAGSLVPSLLGGLPPGVLMAALRAGSLVPSLLGGLLPGGLMAALLAGYLVLSLLGRLPPIRLMAAVLGCRLPERAFQQPLAGALVPSQGQQAHPAQGQGRPEDAHRLHPAAWLRGHPRPGLQAPADLPAASQWPGGGRVGGRDQLQGKAIKTNSFFTH